MPNKTKPVRLSKLNKDTAIYGVLAAVRTFIEDNPDFEGDIVLHVVSFNEKDLKHADNDHVQRLLFRAMQVRTISFEKVQQLALKKVLNSFIQVREMTFEISQNHVNVHLKISKTCF